MIMIYNLGAFIGIQTPSLIFFGVGVVFIIVVWLIIMRTTPQYCCNCHKKVKRFPELAEGQQLLIREHFLEQENRQVDESGVFVCLHCRYMHDDFSGEKHSRQADRSYTQLPNGKVIRSGHWRTICKVCDVIMQPCDPDGAIGCRRCETEYLWVKHEKLDLYILTAQGDRKILKSSSHHFGIA